MKVLILGDANSICLYEYIQRIYINQKLSENITILSHENTKYRDTYNDWKVNVLTYGEDIKCKNRMDLLLRLRRTAINYSVELEEYDLLHIHFMCIDAMVFSRYIWSCAKRHVVTMWGSDLLRASDVYLCGYKSVFDRVDTIHLLTDNMNEYFHKKYGNKYDDKLKVFDFGGAIYETLNRVKEDNSRDECKERYGIARDKISVAVGYNGNEEQQHIKIIDALGKLDEKAKEEIQVIIHFGYGNTQEEYLSRVTAHLKKYGFDYIVIKEFLGKEDIAKLRSAVDLFLYGQTTDAFSASVAEYLYAGTIVVMGEWLYHNEIKKSGVKVYTYLYFDDITGIIDEIVSTGIEKARIQNAGNDIKLWNFKSWDVMIDKWTSLVNGGEIN